ncbi:MAG: CaiB/BaiF CoA transferase family protein [Dehalococcoidia bacterium]
MSNGTALEGLKVLELCSERGSFAGKLLADMGANVIKVEPPGGDITRTYPPFLEDTPGPERSLFFWHYNTNKRSVTLNLETDEGRAQFRRLAGAADILIEDREPGLMAGAGLDYPDLKRANPGLIYTSITPFGRSGPRAHEAATDLTLMASGGIAWMNGYDDHSLPPVAGSGSAPQAYQTGCHMAVMSVLVAVLNRDLTGKGQHIDVNINACINVTTEAGSYSWLVNGTTVQRQTGRHASPTPTIPVQARCKDGRYVNTGVPPRRPRHFATMIRWMEHHGIAEDFPMLPLLEAGRDREELNLADIETDSEVQAIFLAGREVVNYIASNLTAYQFFEEGQQRGMQVGIVYSPEEAMEDIQYKDRGLPVEVQHPELGQSFTYVGAPYKFNKTPWSIRRRAPLVGEDNALLSAWDPWDGAI